LGTAEAKPIMKTMPPLTVTDRGHTVCLELGRLARGEGPSLQEAADDLIQRLLGLVMAFRAGGMNASRELQSDLETMGFLSELGEIAAAGGDIRELVFG
jgi:hypothetical protein